MKKILFIASAILILLSGCSFLDSELLTEKTTANFPETKSAQEMVTAIYAICCLKVLKPLPSITLPSWQVTAVWEATSLLQQLCHQLYVQWQSEYICRHLGPLLHPYQPCQQCHQHNGECEIMVQRERT